MDREQRITYLRKLAQEKRTKHIDIRTMPGFRAELFKLFPDIIRRINILANVLNSDLYKASGGTATFAIVYESPGALPSNFSNDAKHLLFLAKWIYIMITNKTVQYYSLEGLKKFANDLINNVKSRTFTDVGIATRLISAGQSILALMGG